MTQSNQPPQQGQVNAGPDQRQAEPGQPNVGPALNAYSTGPSPVAAATSSPIVSVGAQPKRSSALSLLLGLALVVAVGGVAFAVGRLTAPATAAANLGGSGSLGGGAGLGGGGYFPGGASGAPGLGGGALGGASLTVTGTVKSISPTSISVKTEGGSTSTVAIDGSTTYHGQSPATSSSISVGDTVSVQLNGFGGGGGAGGAQASPPPPVGASGSVPRPGASGGFGRGGTGGQLGPAKDITVVSTP